MIRVAGHEIGDGRRAFVIAEAGVNHNGDVALAERLVDIAADAGCDAVKFQTFEPALLAAPSAEKAEYQRQTTGSDGSQVEMLSKLVLSIDGHARLQRRAHDRGLVFLSTPFDERSADSLEALDIPAFKVSSGDLTNVFLLQHLARKGRPILLSTGMATLAEVHDALSVLRAAGAADIALFHCVSNYPAEPADCNLRAIATLQRETGVPVGWSDHTTGIDVTIAAVALGAQLVEKHFTTDRTLPGPDHRASLEPAELKAMVQGIRRVEAALGSATKQPVASELGTAAVARRSLCYREDVAAGTVLEPRHLIALRPGTGVPTARAQDFLGRRLNRAVRLGQLLNAEDFDPDVC